ncbi:transcription/translation regulatory transformer protein RfaH [Aliikangiella coralliicola]|uniref:Transcription/translation regulatory transformer protein RfaH n=1 Tax=Aliikangiella coralliicola TaxID=2592383 RepID=A0A545U0K6_9GAMM|nr:transcription/translation regulatory transformer protein RfaH [Aliikangiella coralliicola]TQV82999.1 transcription/translation regulatory transformer protein RfaH [Aliikangiella coralliicola]
MSLEPSKHNMTNSWYLATSKPRQELRAIENLTNQGIKAYSPTINVEKIRAGKRKIVSEAMFTGYVFVNLSPEDGLWHKVKSTRGIRDWVRFSGETAKLPEKLVESFISQESSNTNKITKKCFDEGQSVRVLSGPFRGLKGIYEASSGEERSMILIDFLGKVNQLTVKNEQIATD